MISIHVDKVHMPKSTAELLRKFNLEKGWLVQKVIDKTVIDYCLAYVPWDSGNLGMSAYSATTIGSGKVIYPGPYAHYMYYGEVYGPNIPIYEDGAKEPTRWESPKGKKKHPTGRPLKYGTDVNPLAGSFWFERMKADRMQDIIQEAKNVAGIK